MSAMLTMSGAKSSARNGARRARDATVSMVLLAGVACTGQPPVDRASADPPPATVTPARTAPPTVTPAARAFAGAIHAVRPEDVALSWRPGCPVHPRDLRLLRISHWGFDGAVHDGSMIVHRRYAAGIVDIFRKLFAARFAIERMELVDVYSADEDRIGAANDTVGFNCRRSVGRPSSWSDHAYGRAIDINPQQNPYVSSRGVILPPSGRAYVDRRRRAPGMIHPGDVVVRAFRAIGWKWGGAYTRSKDYQHFSATGR